MVRITPCADDIVKCVPPYSFFFDLIQKFFKSPKGAVEPIHRLCLLARKTGAKTVVFECASRHAGVEEEINDLDEALGGGGIAQAIKITFFDKEVLDVNIINSLNNENLLGQFILINYKKEKNKNKNKIISYVYEAVFPRPRAFQPKIGYSVGLLNNYITTGKKFKIKCKSKEFLISSVYYCQQNGETSYCAHSCIRMILNSIEARGSLINTRYINNSVLTFSPKRGLALDDIRQILKKEGQPQIWNCENIPNSRYISNLAAIVESGVPSLLIFSTGGYTEHVVNVCGYTLNTDEWHPEAQRIYSGAKDAQYIESSSWVDHFVVHDDNFGPYYTLASRVLEVDVKTNAKWIIALFPCQITLLPVLIQDIASIRLISLLKRLATYSYIKKIEWLKYVIDHHSGLVLRTILIQKDDYLSHIKNSAGHNDSKHVNYFENYFDKFPKWLWMTEISLPNLFAGNRSKIGEVISIVDFINDRLSKDNTEELGREIVLSIRLPGFLFINDRKGSFMPYQSGIDSHTPIFMIKRAPIEW